MEKEEDILFDSQRIKFEVTIKLWD